MEIGTQREVGWLDRQQKTDRLIERGIVTITFKTPTQIHARGTERTDGWPERMTCTIGYRVTQKDTPRTERGHIEEAIVKRTKQEETHKKRRALKSKSK